MIPTEEPRELPNNLYLPEYLGIKGRDNRARTTWTIGLERGKPYIEEPDGWGLAFEDPETFINIATRYKSIFTFAPDSELDLLLKVFTQRELYNLSNYRTFKHGNVKISQFYPTRIDIRKGNKWTSIYNISPLTKRELNTHGWLNNWLGKLDKFQSFLNMQMNVSSSSASATALLIQLSDKIYQEFRKVMDLSNEELNLIYSSIHNTWMEPSSIGWMPNIEAIDSIKAHLRALQLIPSIRRGKAYIKSRTINPTYTPDALMGFYTIEVDFPPDFPFGLLPFRGTYKSTAPYGLRICTLPKPFLDKLIELKIPFKIHKSVEFLPIGDIEYPFRNYARILEAIIDNYSEDFYPLELKMLTYKTLIGMMQHFHLSPEQPEGDLMPDDFIWSASALFNPAVASTVYGLVNTWVFDILAGSKNPIYRRHDGVSREPEIYLPDNFRRETTGNIFVFSSQIYDKPDEDRWYQIARLERDNERMVIVYPDRTVSRRLARNIPEVIGTRRDFIQTIKPHPDKRLLTKPLKYIGEILDNERPTPGMPSMDDIKLLPRQRYHAEIMENKWSEPHALT